MVYNIYIYTPPKSLKIVGFSAKIRRFFCLLSWDCQVWCWEEPLPSADPLHWDSHRLPGARRSHTDAWFHLHSIDFHVKICIYNIYNICIIIYNYRWYIMIWIWCLHNVAMKFYLSMWSLVRDSIFYLKFECKGIPQGSPRITEIFISPLHTGRLAWSTWRLSDHEKSATALPKRSKHLTETNPLQNSYGIS